MPTSKAEAVWEGSSREGKGRITSGSGAFAVAYTWQARFEEAPGTNPEELLGAAHAGCFSMALAAGLTRAGHPPARIRTVAHVKIESQPTGGWKITNIHLDCTGEVPGINVGEFQQAAEGAKKGCPVSQALAATDITMTATLLE
jgi:osmotically inducible protein OsmC